MLRVIGFGESGRYDAALEPDERLWVVHDDQVCLSDGLREGIIEQFLFNESQAGNQFISALQRQADQEP